MDDRDESWLARQYGYSLVQFRAIALHQAAWRDVATGGSPPGYLLEDWLYTREQARAQRLLRLTGLSRRGLQWDPGFSYPGYGQPSAYLHLWTQ